MADLQTLRNYFHQHQAEMVKSIQELVEFETPSSDHARLDQCARFLEEKFRRLAVETTRVETAGAGDHLRVRWHPPQAERAPVLVLTHFDTVWPVGRLESHPFRIDEANRAYGPGIFDMKTSIIVMEYCFRALQELQWAPARPITFLATSDEEVGSRSSRALIETEASQSAFVLVLEPPLPGGVLKTARKGSQALTMTIRGIPAHAGIEIEKGVSAIEEAAHQILALQGMTNLTTGITVNAGVITGGTASNVVADRAEIHIDLRGWQQAEMERVSGAIRDLRPVLQGTTLEVSVPRARPPLEEAITLGIFGEARKLAASLDMDLQADRTGGGSDGNLTGALGIPTLDGLGVPGAGAHADHEHIELDQLAERSLLIAALLLELSLPSES